MRTMATWITLEEVRQRLGVRAQTVYAYVSRGRIGVSADPQDPRRSLYRADDVLQLAQRKARGRSRETVAATTLFGAEPSIPTAISAFAGGRLYYRGIDAVSFADRSTLEETAALLWATDAPPAFATPGSSRAEPHGRIRAFTELAALAATGLSTLGRTTRVLQEEAAGLVGQLASAFGAAGDAAQPLHQRLAAGWQRPEAADRIRAALVLTADHEITSSAFSARITASTGASLAACLLAGLTTFSGPLHGDASGRVGALFEEAGRSGPDAVVARTLASAIPLPGFGHPIYTDGDPRAAALLTRFTPPEPVARCIERVVALTGLRPNIDVALAALAAHDRLPPDASFALFAIARSVGLLAHAIEQLGIDAVIRPRGRYVGPMPAAEADPRRPRRKVAA